MEKTVWSIPVTADLRPEYYDKFHCLAAGCKFSCCKGWSITFDKKDFLSLKRQKGSEELQHILETGVRRIRGTEHVHYGEFDMRTTVCPLLGEDSLCVLQKERGHEALPEVCRTFPRIKAHMTSGYLEKSLSPACEGVLALLWDLPEGVGFLSDPLPKREMKEMEVEGEDTLHPFFGPVREICIDLLQDRRLPLPERIFLMGAALRELAEGETDMERWAVKARALPETPGAADLLREDAERALPLFLGNNIHILKSVRTMDIALLEAQAEVLSACRLVVSTEDDTTTIPLDPYRKARERFEENFKARDYFMENLMVAFFFHLHMPHTLSREELWKSYVNFCNLYAFCRFMSVMSCREGAAGDRDELFRMLVFVSRSLIHSGARQTALRDELFQNDSATLAHMAILLGG